MPMHEKLTISAGQYSDRGRKPVNQDFHGLRYPPPHQMAAKGIALAVADGISSSAVSHVASAFAVSNFLEDYYCTSDAWSVKTAVERVLSATSSWLHAQTRQGPYRYEQDRGYVSTLSALVLKSTTAHVFHVGDSRIHLLRGGRLEQLTTDHRVSVSSEQSYLGRAMGMDSRLEIDYLALPLEMGDHFLLTTDGVHDYLDTDFALKTIAGHADDLDRAARLLAEEALRRGSADNLTVQVVRIDGLPRPDASELLGQLATLPFAPLPEARLSFDGYRYVRPLHASSRSHVWLAIDEASGTQVVLKHPSIDLRDDPAYIERFLMEEWVARRIDHPHVLKAWVPDRPRGYLYVATEYIDGQTLAQWMIDHPAPDLETVRRIVGQVANGLRAFHRLEMLHQDLRPENIMIDAAGNVTVIDFGSTRVAGIADIRGVEQAEDLLGTPQYTAPEYFLGEQGTPHADQFSLGVITYRLLGGGLPYGTAMARARSAAAQRALPYRPLRDDRPALPAWIDATLRRALHPNPLKRYDDLAEFVHDLQHPNPAFLARRRPPLIEASPTTFWKGVSVCLLLLVVLLLATR